MEKKKISALPVQAIQSPCYTEPALHNVHKEFCFSAGWNIQKNWQPNGLIFLGRTYCRCILHTNTMFCSG